MKQHLLEADSIMVELGGRKLLSDIYLQCRTGEVVGLLGRNGTGKSTLLKVLFGTQSAPDRSIRIDGHHQPAASLRGRWVTYLPQHSFLPANCSVRQIVHLTIPDAVAAKKVLAHDRVRPHLRKTISSLSGGELRYLEVLLLLHLPAPFVLLDEPFSGIEPLYQDSVIELIEEYRHSKGFIITDHIHRGVTRVSDRLVLLENGHAIGIHHKEELETRGYVPKGTFSAAALPSGGATAGAAADLFVPFEIDKQTWRDLDLFDQGRRGPVFQLFNKARTTGGADALQYLLKTPSTELSVLEARRDTIRFFAGSGIELRIRDEQLKAIEHYLSSGIGIFPGFFIDAGLYSLKNLLQPSPQYYTVTQGVRQTVSLFRYLFPEAQGWIESGAPDALAETVLELQQLVTDAKVRALLGPHLPSAEYPLLTRDIARCDAFFRGRGKDALRRMLDIVYEWDAFVAVAQAAEQHDCCFPHYGPGAAPVIKAQGLFHPLLANAVTNDFQMGAAGNCCFISGANMAGKSTFLKSLGLAVYLSHVGFPIPARSYETTLFNGLITTVNLGDNLSQGHSHFYTEVRRVRDVILAIRMKKRMVVIFDELFRGTNVKDASDASQQVIDGLAGIQGSLFLVSTHIVEIAAALQHNPNIFFACFESTMEGGIPWYNYKLRSGISNERMGMTILRNEGILEMLAEMKS